MFAHQVTDDLVGACKVFGGMNMGPDPTPLAAGCARNTEEGVICPANPVGALGAIGVAMREYHHDLIASGHIFDRHADEGIRPLRKALPVAARLVLQSWMTVRLRLDLGDPHRAP
jgi:hypothetical protein